MVQVEHDYFYPGPFKWSVPKRGSCQINLIQRMCLEICAMFHVRVLLTLLPKQFSGLGLATKNVFDLITCSKFMKGGQILLLRGEVSLDSVFP